MKKSKIYILGISIALIILPLYFGFPSVDDGVFFLRDHEKIIYVSETYYIFSKIAQIFCLIGLILFFISFWLIQREFGFKPTLIPPLVDTAFFKELFSRIKKDSALIFIFTVDLFAIIIGLLK